jgi:hypothetical protein
MIFKTSFIVSKEPFISAKRNFCKISGDLGDGNHKAFVEFYGFADVCPQVDKVHEGSEVEISFSIGSKCLTDKNKEPVLVDGRKTWVPELILKSVNIAGMAGAAKAVVKSVFAQAREPGDDI